METFKASIEEKDEHKFLCFLIGTEKLAIPLTEENPQAVKDVFNKLILKLKNGPFKMMMENIGEDLFSQVGSEYIKQLNSELETVYKELAHYDLLIEPEKKAEAA